MQQCRENVLRAIMTRDVKSHPCSIVLSANCIPAPSLCLEMHRCLTSGSKVHSCSHHALSPPRHGQGFCGKELHHQPIAYSSQGISSSSSSPPPKPKEKPTPASLSSFASLVISSQPLPILLSLSISLKPSSSNSGSCSRSLSTKSP